VNRLILDTDIASYLFREVELHSVEAFDGWDKCISFMTVAELRAGARLAHWGSRRMGMLNDLIGTFEVAHSDDESCWFWAEVRAHSRACGREISAQDAWIAATALALDTPLATNNRRDYGHIRGLELLAL
jgi:tRNA(fMet)-specific endonuclease VapC